MQYRGDISDYLGMTEDNRMSDIGGDTSIRRALRTLSTFFLDGGVAYLVQIELQVKHASLKSWLL